VCGRHGCCLACWASVIAPSPISSQMSLPTSRMCVLSMPDVSRPKLRRSSPRVIILADVTTGARSGEQARKALRQSYSELP
jgi:hypothetical protein